MVCPGTELPRLRMTVPVCKRPTMVDAVKEKFSRLIRWGWRRPFTATAILFVLGLSPVGFAIPFLTLSSIGVCGGALGSGVYCHLPQGIAWYFETLAVILEVSCFFAGLCVPWLLAAVAVWVGFFLYLARGLFQFVRSA